MNEGFRWLYPGMRLKRWFFLVALSVVVLMVGFSGFMSQHFSGVHYRPAPIVEMEGHLKGLKFVDFLFMALAIWGIIFGMRRAIRTVLTIFIPEREQDFINIAYQKTRLKRGPRIVAVGGGTGLPNVLSSLKHYTSNLTAIVTVADDGGSSGRLRKDFGTPPPGDIRNCIVALSDQETLLNHLFQYRFKGHGDLKGHSFGNLFITVMKEITGDFGKAVEESSRVLSTRGTVMPVTFDEMNLQARLKNGKIITGESAIGQSRAPIEEVSLTGKKTKPNKEVLKAILEADAIVLGPGSLFTSIIPNLLVPEVPETIALSRAAKIYVCNVMTQQGETEYFTVSDHVKAILKHTGPNFIHYVVANKEKVPQKLLERYAAYGQEPVVVDEPAVEELGVKLVKANLLHQEDFVRHSPEKLGKTIIRLLMI
ncbi:MAG TPA: gluconeogenesis factor YvcK family protein [bacterium]|nr:gluconeogenesis factor YvcK family protein [bacterium]